MKLLLTIFFTSILTVSCSSFKAERVDASKSDEKALEITDNWVSADSEKVIAEVFKDLDDHRGLRSFKSGLGHKPRLFVGEVKNLTTEAYFPINDINDELLNKLSATGEYTLVDAGSRDAILKEITYQNDGMVDPKTSKKIGKQTGADLMVFGNVFMQPATRDGKTVKEYRVNIYFTDIEKGEEVVRVRSKLYKYSKQSKTGW